MIRNQMFSSVEKTFAQCLATMEPKNRDYSTADDPYKNLRACEALGVKAERGILVRLTDKIQRINNLIDHEPYVIDEQLDDSIIDAINYLALLKAMRAAQFETVPATVAFHKDIDQVMQEMDKLDTYDQVMPLAPPPENVIAINANKIWSYITNR